MGTSTERYQRKKKLRKNQEERKNKTGVPAKEKPWLTTQNKVI